MSTEHEIGASCWLALAASVMREEPGSLRYFSFNGFCMRKNSACLSKSLTSSLYRHALRRRTGSQAGGGLASRFALQRPAVGRSARSGVGAGLAEDRSSVVARTNALAAVASGGVARGCGTRSHNLVRLFARLPATSRRVR